jgi:predicted secreted protein
MNWTSALAIYILFWVMSAFIVMPFGMRTAHDEGGEIVPGQAESAPVNFQPGKIILRTTIVATLAFGLFYANYVNGWLTPQMIDITR